MKAKQYSTVKIKKINIKQNDLNNKQRAPHVGDVATIIEIYEKPVPGYELECTDDNGITLWLLAFTATDIEFDIID